MANNVGWRIQGLFKADAAKVNEEISNLGENVKPADLLEYAEQNPDSELHKCFEWDDTAAARKWRLHQAQRIIQCIVIIPASEDKPKIRNYQITTEKNTYMSTTKFLFDQNEYEKLLQRAIAELKAFKERYKNLSELETILNEIGAL